MLVTHEQTKIQTIPYEDMQSLGRVEAGDYSAELTAWRIPESAEPYDFVRRHNESAFRQAALVFADTSGNYPSLRPGGEAAGEKPIILEIGREGRVWFYDARTGLKAYTLVPAENGGLQVAAKKRPAKSDSLSFDPGNTIVFGWVKPKPKDSVPLGHDQPTPLGVVFERVVSTVDASRRRRLLGSLGRHSVRG